MRVGRKTSAAKMPANLIAASAALLLLGCSVVAPDPLPMRDYRAPNLVVGEGFVQSPAVGQVVRTTVGDALISAARTEMTAKLRVLAPMDATSPYGFTRSQTVAATVQPGEYRLVASDFGGGHYFEAPLPPVISMVDLKSGAKEDWTEGKAGGLFVNKSGVYHVYWFWDGWKQPVMAPARNPSVERVLLPLPSGRATFRRELVYTGRSGQSLSLMYREFSNDMARPAFSQVLQYDIGSDPVIGYQGARIRVLSADNTSIRYEVLSTLAAP